MELADFTALRDKLFETTSIKCEIHNVYLIRKKHSKAFCPRCSVVNVAHDEALMIKKETEKAFNKNKRFLRSQSIVTDRKILDLTFSNFEAMDKETTENKQKAIEIARSYYKGLDDNALLSGKFGTGKTHLAMAILNEINKHENKKLMFVAIDELMRKIKSSFNNKDSIYQEDYMIDLLIEADLLVLDDIGAEIGSVNRKTQAGDYSVRILNGILNGRTNKPTIFTTNLSKKDMEEIYDGRIVSRMLRGITQETVVQFKNTTDKRLKIDF